VSGSLAAVLFIVLAAGTAAFVATRGTHATGEAMAADLLPQLRQTVDRTIETVRCDDTIVVRDDVTRFECLATRRDGTYMHLTYSMDRAGAKHGVVTNVDDPPDRFRRMP